MLVLEGAIAPLLVFMGPAPMAPLLVLSGPLDMKVLLLLELIMLGMGGCNVCMAGSIGAKVALFLSKAVPFFYLVHMQQQKIKFRRTTTPQANGMNHPRYSMGYTQSTGLGHVDGLVLS